MAHEYDNHLVSWFISNVSDINVSVTSYLTQINKERTGGSVHSIVAVTGVGTPHVLHPLKMRKKKKKKLVS